MAWAFVFFACLTIDILYVRWTKDVQEGNPLQGALVSALIQVVGVGAILFIVKDWHLLIANVLGHSIGSYVGISWAKKRRQASVPVARVLDRD